MRRAINLLDIETEEVLGTVLLPILGDNDEIFDNVHLGWEEYHKYIGSEPKNVKEFVNWYNNNDEYEGYVEYLEVGYIHLSIY